MVQQKTVDSVKAFKRFVQENPELVKGVKEQNKTWHDIFEEWVLFGENHEVWETYGIKVDKKNGKKGDTFKKVVSFINGIDTKNLGERLDVLSGALNNIQELMGQFQPKQNDNGAVQQSNPPNQPQQPYQQQMPPYQGPPYMYRRD